MIRRDYLLRTVEQLAAFLARVVGLARAGRHDEAQREVSAALGSLGVDLTMVERLDPSSLVMLLGERHKIEAVAALLDAQADLWRATGNAERAGPLAARAERLRLLARRGD